MRKKLYLVKREVIATNIGDALTKSGHFYEIVLADEKSWPEVKKKIGYKKSNEKT